MLTNDSKAVSIDNRQILPKTVASFVRLDSDGVRIPDESKASNVPFNIADGASHPISDFVGAGKAWANGDAVHADYPLIPAAADMATYDLAWASIMTAITAVAPQPVILPRGRYVLMRPLVISGAGLIGAGFGIDDTTEATVIESTANPVVYVAPYPGTILQDLHVRGLGTSDSIETWDAAEYPGQVGIWAGKIDGVLTVAGGDGYGAGGSGALYMDRVSFSGDLGRAFYAYKLWGQSTLSNLHFYHVGASVGSDVDHYGAMTFHGECADLNVGPVHIIGDSAGYGIQLGANKTETDALDRFYVPPTHHRFHDVFIEGSGEHAVRQYCTLRSAWHKCFFGGLWTDIEIGENPYVSPNNNETSWTDCGSFGLGAIHVKAERTNIQDWLHESGPPLPVYYYYSSICLRGKNLDLRPSGDKTKLYGGGNDTIINRPVAITDTADSALNLCPLFSSSAWTGAPISGQPTSAYMVSPVQYRLFGSGTVAAKTTLSLTGLTGEHVYTCAFRHVVGIDPALRADSTYTLKDSGGNTLFANLVGYDETAVSGISTYILFQFVAPVDGQISLEFANANENQCYFWLPKIVPGAAHYVDHLRELIACDPLTNAVTGYPIGTIDHLAYGQNLTTMSDLGAVSSLVSTSAVTASNRLAGVGANARFDGTNWRTGDDGAGNNGGAVVASNIGSGNLRVYVIGQDGGRGQTLTPAQLEALVAVTVNADRTIDAVNDVRIAARARVGSSGAPAKTLHVEDAANTQLRVKAGSSDGPSDALVYVMDATGNLLFQVLQSGAGTVVASVSGTAFQVIGPSPSFTPYWVVQPTKSFVPGLNISGLTASTPVRSNASKDLVSGKISLGSTDDVTISGSAGSLVKIVTGGALGAESLSTLITDILADTSFQNAVDTRVNTIINNLLSNGTLVGSSAIGVSIAAHPHTHHFSVASHSHGGVTAGTDTTASDGGDGGNTGIDE